jgi:hypothetical protein
MAMGMVAMIAMIMDADGLTMGAMRMAMIGMDQGGLTVGAIAMTIGMIVGPGGRTVGVMVLVGIRVTGRMSPQGMGITLTPTSATPQGMAGIHAPTIIMGIEARPIEVRCWLRHR